VYKETSINTMLERVRLTTQHRDSNTLRVGDATGVCRLLAQSKSCQGPLCDEDLTLTMQGGYYVSLAYSTEPGNNITAPDSDTCAFLNEGPLGWNTINNLFDCTGPTRTGPFETARHTTLNKTRTARRTPAAAKPRRECDPSDPNCVPCDPT
jgi:hypothetical protein